MSTACAVLSRALLGLAIIIGALALFVRSKGQP